MDERSMQRALLATARIAGVVTLVGCGGARSGASATAPLAPALAPTAVAAAEPGVEDPVCEEVLGALAAATSTGVPELDGQQQVCCTTYVEELASDEGAGSLVQAFPDLRWTCCAASESPPMACTPWGPPAPPAMV